MSAGLAVAQYSDSPAPPRLNIPGAIPLPVLRAQQPGGGQPGQAYRTGPVLVRTRRPLKGRLQHSPPAPLASTSTSYSSSAPVPNTRPELDAKPVTEEIEEPTEAQGPFVPSPRLLGSSQPAPQLLSLSPQSPRAPHQKKLPQPKFFDPNPIGEDDGPIARFQQQERPTAVPVQVARFNGQPNQQQQQKQAHRPTPAAAYRAQEQQQDEPQHRQREQQVRPTPRYNNHDNGREKKPVAQILRKYREEHEDGTITWGYENDDGSFKEETIGIDCVTR